jgi:hypothetical protein
MFKSNSDAAAAVQAISQDGAESNRNHAALPGEWAYHNGGVLSGAAIHDILDRLDKASQVARRIDARQMKLDGSHGKDYRSPVLRLAGLIEGIYNTLDREYGNAQYVHDVREELIPVSKIRRGH